MYRGAQFLVARRSRDGIWNVIAGQIEDGESFIDGASRELMEEAQLDAPLLDLAMHQVYEVEPAFRHLYAPGDHSVAIECFAAQAPANWEPTLNHEHDMYRWCSVVEAVELLHWPEMKEGIRAAARKLGLPH